MATVVKLRGLDRAGSATPDGSATGGSYRGFKVKSALGPSVTGGTSVAASLTPATGTGKVTVTSKIGGAKGNNIQFALAAASGSAEVVAVTYASTTGYPTITVTPRTGGTAAQVVAAVNADPVASQFVTASVNTAGAVGTNAAAPLANGADGTGTSEPFYQSVNGKTTVLADVDDQVTVRTLKRNANRWISLGAA